MFEKSDCCRQLGNQSFRTWLHFSGWVVLLALALGSGSLKAARVDAASCSASDVQTAVDQARDGDTVAIPPGQCTWSTMVEVPDTKALRILGSGIDSTVITPSAQPHSLRAWVPGRDIFELAHMTFSGGISDVTGYVRVRGVGRFRLHHLKFDRPRSKQIVVGHRSQSDNTYGLIDNCIFSGPSPVQSIFVFGSSASSWSNQLSLGSRDAVFIEDNLYDWSRADTGQGAMDANEGARIVFRHNEVKNVHFIVHGRCGSAHGTMQIEIYENRFEVTDGELARFMYIRGGTGVVFNNTMIGSSNTEGIHLTNFASCYDFCRSAELCTDYPCPDQIGRGTDQQLSPLYGWGNRFNNRTAEMSLHDACAALQDHVQEGRDFINSQSKPGYSPYRYPHPLTENDDRLSPPSNLTATQPPN